MASVFSVVWQFLSKRAICFGTLFSHFVILHREKSGNPGPQECQLDFWSRQRRHRRPEHRSMPLSIDFYETANSIEILNLLKILKNGRIVPNFNVSLQQLDQ
jgi:hypothetical protein